jgi:protein TonB
LAATVVAHAGVVAVVFWGGELAALTPPVEVEGILTVGEHEIAPSGSEPVATAEPTAPANALRAPFHAKSAEPKRNADDAAKSLTGEKGAAGTQLTQPAASEEHPFDDSFVTGDADSYAGGLTSGLGRSIAARASDGGSHGRTAGAARGPGRAPDLSRRAGLGAPARWECAFPWEADRDEIDHAVAWIAVQVKPDGSAQSVDVVRDPGHGFGRAAKSCAMRERFLTALDGAGRAVTGTTLPIRVDFTKRPP